MEDQYIFHCWQYLHVSQPLQQCKHKSNAKRGITSFFKQEGVACILVRAVFGGEAMNMMNDQGWLKQETW
jgi:hypothetical protein